MSAERSKIHLGDTHSVRMVRYLIEQNNIKNADIYHVGDFGLGFLEKSHDMDNLKYVEEALEARDIKLFVNRGNHDNPEWWTEQLYKSDFIRLVDSYEIIDDTLFLGGAISIDRLPRIAENAGWWKNEYFEYKNCENIKNIKHVISHTAPDFCYPIDLGYIVNHYIQLEKESGINTLKEELKEERALVTKVYNELIVNNDIETWHYGHFHKYYFLNYQFTNFYCLPINHFQL